MISRVRGSALNPLLQGGDFLRDQWTIGRHLQVGVLVADGLNQRTRLGISRNDRQTPITSFQPTWATVKQQPSFTLPRANGVARVAALGEEWSDLFLEKHDIITRRFAGADGPTCQQGREQCGPPEVSLGIAGENHRSILANSAEENEP